jgi:hypothetical protein
VHRRHGQALPEKANQELPLQGASDASHNINV